MASKSAIKLQCKALPLSGSDALALAAELDSRSEAGALDLGAMTNPDAVRAVVAGEAEPPALQPPQEPDIDLGAMPMHAGRADVPVAAVAAAPAPPPVAASAAAASTARPVAPPPQARRGFDADAFADQMQRAADKGDADTLGALGEQLRDVPGEGLRATLTDMHERLRAGLDQPRQPEAPQRPQPGMPPVPPARRRTAPRPEGDRRAEQLFQGEPSGVGHFSSLPLLPIPRSSRAAALSSFQKCHKEPCPCLSSLCPDAGKAGCLRFAQFFAATMDSRCLQTQLQHRQGLQGDMAGRADYSFSSPDCFSRPAQLRLPPVLFPPLIAPATAGVPVLGSRGAAALDQGSFESGASGVG